MTKLTMVEIAATMAKYDIETKFYVDRLEFYCDATTRYSDLEIICHWNKKNKILWQSLPHNPQFDKKVEIYQPTNEQLLELVNLVKTKIIGDYIINFIELAVDFRHLDAKKLNNLKLFFVRHLVVKHPRSEPYYKSLNETLYYSNQRDFGFAFYLDLDNRKDKYKNSLHFECRISTSAKLKKLKIFSMQNLLDFDHNGFWDEYLTLYYPNYTKLGQYAYTLSHKYLKKPLIERQTQSKWGRKLWGNFVVLQEFLANNPDCYKYLRRIITTSKFESYLTSTMKKRFLL